MPGDRPVARLLTALEQSPPAGRSRVIVVDQFEELFTLCQDVVGHQQVLAALADLTAPARRTRVVLGVRGDLFERCAGHPAVAAALSRATLLVGPLTADELRQAVVRPAATTGYLVERELTHRILEDVSGRPGALPLLSHTLREVWLRRSGRTLSLRTYEALGGVQGALATTADALLERLTEAEVDAVRGLLLRLVAPAARGRHSHRPASVEEVEELVEHAPTGHALNTLTEARLVTVDDEHVHLAHEALITGWPRLRAWLDEAGDLLPQQQVVRAASQDWESLGRDPGTLLRGHRLGLAEPLLSPPPGSPQLLTPPEREFLLASVAARQFEQHQARRRRRTVLRWTAAAVAVLIGGGIGSVRQAQVEVRTSAARADAARAGAAADTLRSTDPVTAMLLDVAAARLHPSAESTGGPLAARHQLEQRLVDLPDKRTMEPAQVTADGRRAFVLEPARVTEIDLGTGRRTVHPGVGERAAAPTPTARSDPGPADLPGAVSPDGTTIARVGPDGASTVLQDLRTGTATGTTFQGVPLDFSADGRFLVTMPVRGGRMELREVATGRPAHRVPDVSGLWLQGATGPTGSWLVFCGTDGRLTLWTTGPGDGTRRPLAGAGRCDNLLSVSSSRDGSRVLATTLRKESIVWEVPTGRRVATVPGAHSATGLSPDGRYGLFLDDRTMAVVRLGDEPLPVHRIPVAIDAVHVVWSDPGTIRLFSWGAALSLDVSSIVRRPGSVDRSNTAMLTPDGARLVTGRRDPAGYRVAFGRPGETVGPTGGLRVSRGPDLDDFLMLGTSGDGRRVGLSAGGLRQGPDAHRVLVVDPASGRTVARVPSGPVLTPPEMSFNHDGSLMAVPGDDGEGPSSSVHLWDTRTTTLVQRVADVDRRWSAFTADGRWLVTAAGAVDLRRPGAAPLAVDLSRMGEVVSLAAGPGAGEVMIGDDAGRILRWDVARRQTRLIGLLPAGAAGPPPSVLALTLSHDRSRVAVTLADGTVRLWDLQAGRPLGPALPSGEVTAVTVAFSADDATLVSADPDGGVRRFALRPAELARQVCDRAGRDLTPTEWAVYLPGRAFRPVCG